MSKLTSTSSLRALPGRLRRWVVAGVLAGSLLTPAADILLANWEPDSPEAFLEAVRWAKAEGARIMTCSVIMPSWSDGEGRGSVHSALTQILGADVLFCASAGNTAKRHWSGAF